jgi:hypothetical protein
VSECHGCRKQISPDVDFVYGVDGSRWHLPCRCSAESKLKDLNRRRGRLSDLLTAIERVRAFVDEHNERDRGEVLDALDRYTHVAVTDLMHVCEEGDRQSLAAGLHSTQWRFL